MIVEGLRPLAVPIGSVVPLEDEGDVEATRVLNRLLNDEAALWGEDIAEAYV